jgi:hypothetical protein
MIRKIVLIISIIFLVLLLAGNMKPSIPTEESFASNLFFNYEITRYPSSAEVISVLLGKNITIGVDIGPDNLNFGAIPGNGSISKRFINLTNLDKNARVYLEAVGTIKPFVGFDKNDFLINSNEKITVSVFFNTTNANIGNYSGNIYLVVERSKYDLF